MQAPTEEEPPDRTEKLSELVTLVYEELRRLASFYLSRERPGHTLQTTALVHGPTRERLCR
jgi:hypothetical protein